MNRRSCLGAALAAFTLSACDTLPKGGDSLMARLAEQLGVTPQQAGAGAGSLLALAREKLPAADFSKVAASIPGAGRYIDLAKTALGQDLAINSPAAVQSAFWKLGMNPTLIDKFKPILLDTAGTIGGEPVKQLLTKAWA